jgi:hypothetical protein
MLFRLKCDLPIDDLLDGTWAKKNGPVPVKEKPESQVRAAKTPEKPQKSNPIKANKGKKTDANPADAEPVKPAGAEEIKACLNRKDRPPQTEKEPIVPPSSANET